MALASCHTTPISDAGTNSTGMTETETTIDDGHNSKIVLNYFGIFTGMLPCADCQGIQTEITLNQDNTYTKRMTYLGKSGDNVFAEKGNYTWDAAGQRINLEGQAAPNPYFAGENTLTQLDIKGEKNEGDLAEMYVLKKIEPVDE